MSYEATVYVAEHVTGIRISPRALLDAMARLAGRDGRLRIDIGTIARRIGLTPGWGYRLVRRLREAGLVVRQGRTWLIRGVADHHISACGHDACIREHRYQLRSRGPQLAAALLAAAENADRSTERPEPESGTRQWRKHKRGRGVRAP